MDGTNRSTALVAVITAVGLGVAGWLAGHGFVAARTAESSRPRARAWESW